MISVDSTKWVNDNKIKFAFIGLPSDSKPTGSYEGKQIANGSTFLQMRTATESMKVWFYDEETGAWA